MLVPKLNDENRLIWRARQESNLRPLASEANTLSTELRAPINCRIG